MRIVGLLARCRAAVVAGAALVSVAGCAVNKTETLKSGSENSRVAERLAGEAAETFSRQPRTLDSVRNAYMLMGNAAKQSEASNPARYGFLTTAARYAIWIATRVESEAEQLAEEAVVFCNTAIATDSLSIEGYYYRAIAIGLIARRDKLKGRSAMNDIRDDSRRAIEIDPRFDHGGPHRVLGALYLRAPGPPAGLGSKRRAVSHLETALELGSKYPENSLFLAEAYLAVERLAEAAVLLDQVSSALENERDSDNLSRWQERLAVLRSELDSAKK